MEGNYVNLTDLGKALQKLGEPLHTHGAEQPIEIRGPGWERVGPRAPTGDKNKYLREIKPGVFIDVYDVLKAWDVRCPALQHLIKKALQPGKRGHKTLAEDMDDIVASAKRARELAK